MTADPLAVACPLCGAERRDPCTRQSGSHNTVGNPLRRAHAARYAAAHAAIEEWIANLARNLDR